MNKYIKLNFYFIYLNEIFEKYCVKVEVENEFKFF